MTISTEPQTTIAIKPDGHTDSGIAYQYMTTAEAEAFIADIQERVAHLKAATA